MFALRQLHKIQRLYSTSAEIFTKMASFAGKGTKKVKKKQPPIAKTTSEEDYYHKGLARLAKQYGPVYRIDLGWVKVVVLNSYEAIREAFVHKGQIFGGRPDDPRDKYVNPNHPKISGIQADSYGEEWKAQRTTTMKLLTRVGFGKEKSHKAIQHEARRLIEHFKSLEGKPVDPTDAINIVISNVVGNLVYGQTYPIGDETFLNLVNSVFLLIELYLKHEDEDYNLFWRKSKAYKQNIERITQTGAIVNAFIDAKIKEHQENLDTTKDPSDFIEAYLTEFQKAKENATGDAGAVIKENWLFNNIQDLFGAGFESSAVSLRWCLLYMLNYPDVMAKVQQEVDSVCGDTKPIPDYADKSEMPYTMAVIYEVLRHASTAQFSLPHETMEDVELGEYFIPKETEVWGNIYAVLHDENVFPDPEAFKPERFIDEDGEVTKPPQWIPFSMGRRGCMGELLARTEIFLIFSALMRTFNISAPPDSATPDLEPVMVFVLHPQKYQCCFTPRV